MSSESIALTVFAHRLHFRALDPIYFPPGKAANTLRGALGLALSDAKRGTDFAPRAIRGSVPSGFRDPPRPFLLRTQALEADGPIHELGSVFHFDIHIFRRDATFITQVVRAFDRYTLEGLGPAKGRMKLTSVVNLAATGLSEAIHLPLLPDPHSPEIPRLRLRFSTPTELKHGSILAERPDFPILFKSLSGRISALQALYGPQPLDLDMKSLNDQARQIQLIDFNSEHRRVTRRSSRTTQSHPIGGFVGQATYEGPLRQFLPWLRAGYWTGVGRQTSWGKGAIEVVDL